jgi:hypothetical protein
MDTDAMRSLDLTQKMRRLYEQGSQDDAFALYRALEPTWSDVEQRSLWEGDIDQVSRAVDLLVWMAGQKDLPPFRTDWPEWLKRWILSTQRPVKILKPLTLLRRKPQAESAPESASRRCTTRLPQRTLPSP